MDYNYMARERALAMAQADWYASKIAEDQVIPRACQYEAYLLRRPVGLAPGQTLADLGQPEVAS
jgi:hypothetical protein